MTKNLDNEGLKSIIDNYDIFYIDLWGVVHNGIALNKRAIETLNEITKVKKEYVLLTNAPRPNKIVKIFLEKMGMNKEVREKVYSSGEASLNYLKRNYLEQKFYHIGPPKDFDLFLEFENNKRKNIQESAYLLCTGLFEGQEEDLDYYKKLLEGHTSKKMICTNPDLIVDRGSKRELCAGSVALVFEKMGGEVIYFGKPFPEVYNQSIDNKEKKVLSIGDNLNTDIKGANLLNYDSLLISNGVHKNEIKKDGIELVSKRYGVIANFIQTELKWWNMKLYQDFNVLKNHKKSIILIGNFDGVHRGHRKLFELANNYKKKFKLNIGVITFEPMPKMYFNKNVKNFRLSSISQKNKILKSLGVDFIITKKFDKSFSKVKSEFFIEDILSKKLEARYIFVSNNFRFGNKREGDVKQLIKNEKTYDYKLVKPQPLILGKKVISSTYIRLLLEEGNLKKANKALTRNWAIEGIVQKGRQQGKKIGFPTCNIDIKDYVIAMPGVYAVSVKQKNSNKSLKAIANLGYRPTFNQKKILLEVHIFNFSGNLYNKYLSVEFIKFIRKEKKFNNVNQLRKQIQSDLKIAKKI